MRPLLQRHVLARELDNFLGNETSKHGSLGGDRARAVCSDLLANAFINFLNIDLLLLLVGSIDSFGDFEDFSEVSLVVTWVSALVVLELMNTANCQV